MAGKPSPMPAERLSTTSTRPSKSAAASRAASTVPDSAAEMCTETIAVGAVVEQSAVRPGELLGCRREVVAVTRRALSARVASAGWVSTPSSPSAPLSTTVNGTTVSRCACTSSGGR